jgi:SAM-dependent methyltransferase
VSRPEANAHYGKRRPLSVRLMRALLRPVDLKARPTLHDRLREQYVFGAPPGTLILNVGSGIESFVDDTRVVNFDIAPHANTHVVGDGHHLPFASDSFDVVWLSAVLEHVRKPWLVAEQIYEVLKPGGVVLVSVPFIQKRHGSPNDYYRYTADGLRSVFDRFEELEAGASFTGPTGTAVHVFAAWMNAVVPGRIGFALEAIVARLLSPLTYMDRLISRESIERGILSGGSCYLGRKPLAPSGALNGGRRR